MKRLLALFLMIILVFTLVACGNNDADKPNDSTPTGNDTTVSADENNNATNGSLTVDTVKNAQETAASLFEYEEVEGGVSITKYLGEDELIVVPSVIDGKDVVSLGEMVFANNEVIRACKLSDCIQEISKRAFTNCTNLEIFISGSQVKIIDDYAFNNCTKLQFVELNQGLEKIGLGAFGFAPFKEIEIPSTVKEMNYPFVSLGDGEYRTIIGETGSYAEQFVKENAESFCLKFQAK